MRRPTRSSRTGQTAGRLVAKLVVCSVLLSGLSIGFADRTEAMDERVSHWNIFGTCAGAGMCGGYDAVDTLAWLVLSTPTPPIMITINEMCANDSRVGFITPMDRLSIQLTSAGYAPRFRGTSYSVNCGGGHGTTFRDFGNAIYMVGAVSTNPSTDQYLPQQAIPSHNRRLSCYETAIFSLVSRGCVTHLDPSDSIATIQSQQAAWIVQSNIGWIPVNVGADLNIGSTPGWTQFRKVSTAPTYPAWGPLLTIDHLMGSLAWHSATGWGGRYCNAAVSDHCLISGMHVS